MTVTYDRRVKPDAAKIAQDQLTDARCKVHLLRATLAKALGLLARGATNDSFMRSARSILEETGNG